MLSRTIFQINPTPKLVHPGGLPMVMIAVDHGVLVVVAVGIYIADGTKARIADHTMSGGSVFRTASFIAAMIMGTMWNATVHTLTAVGGVESCTTGPMPRMKSANEYSIFWKCLPHVEPQVCNCCLVMRPSSSHGLARLDVNTVGFPFC